MIDIDDVIRICAIDLEKPKYLSKVPVRYVTEEMFRERIQAHKYNMEGPEESTTPPEYMGGLVFGDGFSG